MPVFDADGFYIFFGIIAAYAGLTYLCTLLVKVFDIVMEWLSKSPK